MFSRYYQCRRSGFGRFKYNFGPYLYVPVFMLTGIFAEGQAITDVYLKRDTCRWKGPHTYANHMSEPKLADPRTSAGDQFPLGANAMQPGNEFTLVLPSDVGSAFVLCKNHVEFTVDTNPSGAGMARNKPL